MYGLDSTWFKDEQEKQRVQLIENQLIKSTGFFAVRDHEKNNHFPAYRKPEDVYKCLPCREGCSYCTGNTPCYAQEDTYLRITIIAFQALCMVLDFISMLVVYHVRRTKTIRASSLLLIETILCGALLLYFPVIILYFEPSVFRCILLRWVRLLGFAVVYGTVILKQYRVLKVFLSRTAQRIPYMTSWRVMRMLGIILLIVIWFLIAWTSAVFQNMDRNVPLIIQGKSIDNYRFNMCIMERWDYMMAIAEFLFLLWGVYLCYAVRTVPSTFHEPRYMTIAVHNELIISAIFHTIRFTLASMLHPDWMLMLFFIHVHLTVSVTLGLLLIPKFLQGRTNPRDDIATEAFEDELDMGRSGSYLNSSITSAWSEHSLDPEEIRTADEMCHLNSINGYGVQSCDTVWGKHDDDELKKLYAQLEIYKRKKMIANNPHIQKKRSSKKGLGRSIMRRITEIPETVSRQCGRDEKDFTDYADTRGSICAVRKNPFDPSISHIKSKEEALKNIVFSLKKSHSSYDHVRDQNEVSNSFAKEKMDFTNNENSLLNSLMDKHLIRQSAENIDEASTESVPLVCKSASAHNLSADKKPLHPRQSMLQKSLSVIANAKERTLGLSGKTQSADENVKHLKPHRKDKTESGELQQNAAAIQTEEPNKAYKHGIMKQQPATPDAGNSVTKDKSDQEDICPWETQDLPPSSLSLETKVQKHVSIAPVESEHIHASHAKGKVSGKNKSNEVHKQTLHKGLEKTDKCLKDKEFKEPHSSNNEKKKSLTLKPHVSKGEMVSKTYMPDVCPWEFEEQTVMGLEETPDTSHVTEKGDMKKETSPQDYKRLNSDNIDSDSETQNTSSNREDVCPWEFVSPESTITESKNAPSPSTTHLLKPGEQIQKKKGFGLNVKAKLIPGKGREPEKGAEKHDGKTKARNKERVRAEKDTDLKTDKTKCPEFCQWEVHDSLDISTDKGKNRTSNDPGTDKSKISEICPWEVLDDSSAKEASAHCIPSTKENKSSKVIHSEKSKLAEICPWDYEEQVPNDQA
ncbi:probable G-protein coupled receptor 158 [Protopterus annectens]|uniref:probable G-protein coupled receptor 158 n=1 Tax=Protopterus annectens TaxID=7888 RepID=UPI001CFB2F1C|nr:probable G-protein coupled receptor 158 [Protopterus annectens]